MAGPYRWRFRITVICLYEAGKVVADNIHIPTTYMGGFEQLTPKEAPDPQIAEGALEALKHGNFSLSPEEEDLIRKEAVRLGMDADEAIKTKRREMKSATERLRSKQGENMREETERGLSG